MPRHAAVFADIGGHTFQGHDRTRASLFGNPGVFGCHHIHDDAALQHLRQPCLHCEGAGFRPTVMIVSIFAHLTLLSWHSSAC